MKINFDKSAILRVGKRYKVIVVPPMPDSHVLRLCSEMCYLGLYFVSGYVLRCNFHRAKAKYFGSLNSLLGKLGSTPLGEPSTIFSIFKLLTESNIWT